ncbi:MAG: hypothetical protein GEV03_10310 [Streptosporangiales bacterium]|nr:hypothetical protein [Streptosporangiales bacterium]
MAAGAGESAGFLGGGMAWSWRAATALPRRGWFVRASSEKLLTLLVIQTNDSWGAQDEGDETADVQGDRRWPAEPRRDADPGRQSHPCRQNKWSKNQEPHGSPSVACLGGLLLEEDRVRAGTEGRLGRRELGQLPRRDRVVADLSGIVWSRPCRNAVDLTPDPQIPISGGTEDQERLIIDVYRDPAVSETLAAGPGVDDDLRFGYLQHLTGLITEPKVMVPTFLVGGDERPIVGRQRQPAVRTTKAEHVGRRVDGHRAVRVLRAHDVIA